MEPPEIIDAAIPSVMKSVGFWSGKEHIARAIVDGLLASAYLWIFWAPFITGIALPLNTAMVKQAVCWGSHNSGYVPGTNYLPPTSHDVSETLVNDNTSMYPQNTIQLALLWSVGIVWVFACFWCANSLIKAAGLKWWNVMIFNFVMAILIVIVETCFFVGVALRFNPYNLENVYNGILPTITDTINKFINVGGNMPHSSPNIPRPNQLTPINGPGANR